MRQTLDSHSRRRPGPFSHGAVDPGLRRDLGEPTLGAIAERLILDHVVDTGETTTSTTYEPRYQWSGGISPERLSEGPALLLDKIDQSDAANADGIADVGNLGPLDAPARLLGDDDTSTPPPS
jgi:hypothetical protein